MTDKEALELLHDCDHYVNTAVTLMESCFELLGDHCRRQGYDDDMKPNEIKALESILEKVDYDFRHISGALSEVLQTLDKDYYEDL